MCVHDLLRWSGLMPAGGAGRTERLDLYVPAAAATPSRKNRRKMNE